VDPISALNDGVEELRQSFDPTLVIGTFTQYTLWMVIVFVILLALILPAARKVSVVPKPGFGLANLIEYGYSYVCHEMGENAIGRGYERHIPFLATLFFYILIANFLGLVPGFKTSTGSVHVTWALSIISFIYFNYYGIKCRGGWGYVKSIAPSGLPAPLVPIIWFFELISLCIRVLTLAVRLYGNMFAGHMVLGVFALATSVFIQSAIVNMSFVTALPSIGWFALLFAMYALETLFAWLQAYVFTVLSAVYVGLATSPSH